MTTLKDFVSTSLAEIYEGILDAKRKSGVWVAPGRVADKDVWGQQLVSFDIAVTTTKEVGGGIAIKIVNANADRSTESVNRVQFAVPVYFEAISDAQNS